jgi:hypothetical protein
MQSLETRSFALGVDDQHPGNIVVTNSQASKCFVIRHFVGQNTHPGGVAGDHPRGVRPPRRTTSRLTERTNASRCALVTLVTADARWPSFSRRSCARWILAVDDATPPVGTVVRRGSQVFPRRHYPFRRSPAPTVKGARDKQPKDRQRQTKENKGHEGTNNHVQHRVPPTWLFFPLHFNRALVEQKRSDKDTSAMPSAFFKRPLFELGFLRGISPPCRRHVNTTERQYPL